LHTHQCSTIYKNVIQFTTIRQEVITILNHIDVFIFDKYGSKISPLLNERTLPILVSHYFDYQVSRQELSSWFEGLNKPKIGPVIVRVREMGLQPKTIAEWMEVNESTVSYHLHKLKQPKYCNIHIDRIQQKINKINTHYGDELR